MLRLLFFCLLLAYLAAIWIWLISNAQRLKDSSNGAPIICVCRFFQFFYRSIKAQAVESQRLGHKDVFKFCPSRSVFDTCKQFLMQPFTGAQTREFDFDISVWD